MIISVYGAGYVGLVSAACLAKLGHKVICADINQERIANLKQGHCPIYEIDLPQLLQEQHELGRLSYTDNLSDAINNASVHIIAVGTPGLADGSADLSQVRNLVARLANEINHDAVLVTKSTVPVGTGDKLQAEVNQILKARQTTIRLTLASNPEFLREGTAVYDFLKADRIIIGGSEEALSLLATLYQPLVDEGVPLLRMSLRSAELTKYAANAMLACRISFMNQMSQLAEKLGADIHEVRDGMALDPRIGPQFLQAGIGYGGSCFPKDVRALLQIGRSQGLELELLDATERANQIQKEWVFNKIADHFNHQLAGLTIGIWGLAFKPGTDDMREASSLIAIQSLLDAGVSIRVYDPVAIDSAKKVLQLSGALQFCSNAQEVLEGKLDALVIITEWSEFKTFSLDTLRSSLGASPLFDGRNCYELSAVIDAGIAHYYSVGRPVIHFEHFKPVE